MVTCKGCGAPAGEEHSGYRIDHDICVETLTADLSALRARNAELEAQVTEGDESMRGVLDLLDAKDITDLRELLSHATRFELKSKPRIFVLMDCLGVWQVFDFTGLLSEHKTQAEALADARERARKATGDG